MLKWLLCVLFILFPAIGWALDLSQTPTDMRVTYTEPTVSADGTPLADLESTIISVEEKGVEIYNMEIFAGDPAGGAVINHTVPVNVAVGEDRTFVTTVVAKDLSQNRSVPVSKTITFDRLAPGPVTD